jgi:hypothetical protein
MGAALFCSWYNTKHMEFEKNAPVTAEDVALADAQHVTVQPVHQEIHADLSDAPLITSMESSRTFEFESEATTPSSDKSQSSSHPHRRIALLLAALIAILFAGGLYAVFQLR